MTRFTRRDPVCARSLALLVAGALAVGTAPFAVRAADAAAPAARTYAIAAMPLQDALNQFGRDTGLLLSFDPALVRGLDAPGLTGTFGPAEGLARLLEPHGLAAVQALDGSYHVRRIPLDTPRVAGVAQLSEIRVLGTSEGTGAFTTRLTDTATRMSLSLRETPQSVTVMTRQRLNDQGLTEVGDVLDQTIGVHDMRAGPMGADASEVYVRGFLMENYQVNGVPRSSRHGFHEDIADTAIYDRVEVVRGASGLLTGMSEPSGTVNLVRKLPTSAFQASVAARYGSWRFRRVEADVSGPLNEAGTVRGRVVAMRQDNDTFTSRMHLDKRVIYGVLEADLGPSTLLSVGVEYQRHDIQGVSGYLSGVPLVFADGTPTAFGPSTNLSAGWAGDQRRSTTVFSSLEHFFANDWHVRLDLEHSRRLYDTVTASVWELMSDGSGSFGGVRWRGKPEQSTVALHATGPFELLGRSHELVLGANYSALRETGPNYKGFEHAEPDLWGVIGTGHYPRVDMPATGSSSRLRDEQSGLYAAARLRPLERVSVLLGTRWSHWRARTDDIEADGTRLRGETGRARGEMTPFAGVVVDVLPEVSVYASHSRVFQPATVYDAEGNPLAPAKGVNTEAGVKVSLMDGALNLAGAVYRTRKDNEPEYVPGPNGTVSRGPTGRFIYRGVDGTQTQGFELEIAGRLARGWQAGGGYAYASPRDGDGNPRLTYVPQRTFKLFTTYEPAWLLADLTVGANMRWQSRTRGNHGEQGSVAVFDAMAQYRFDEHWQATLNVNNVLDRRYYTDVHYNGWFGAPRSAFVTLEYRY